MGATSVNGINGLTVALLTLNETEEKTGNYDCCSYSKAQDDQGMGPDPRSNKCTVRGQNEFLSSTNYIFLRGEKAVYWQFADNALAIYNEKKGTQAHAHSSPSVGSVNGSVQLLSSAS